MSSVGMRLKCDRERLTWFVPVVLDPGAIGKYGRVHHFFDLCPGLPRDHVEPHPGSVQQDVGVIGDAISFSLGTNLMRAVEHPVCAAQAPKQ